MTPPVEEERREKERENDRMKHTQPSETYKPSKHILNTQFDKHNKPFPTHLNLHSKGVLKIQIDL